MKRKILYFIVPVLIISAVIIVFFEIVDSSGVEPYSIYSHSTYELGVIIEPERHLGNAFPPGFDFSTSPIIAADAYRLAPNVSEAGDLYHEYDSGKRLSYCVTYDTTRGLCSYTFFCFTDNGSDRAQCCGRSIQMEKALFSSAFWGIKKGTSVFEVAAVDRSVTSSWAYATCFSTNPEISEEYLRTYHLLLDGLLVIQYELREDGDGTVTAYVTEKNLYRDFCDHSSEYAYCYKIDIRDYKWK